MRRAAVLGLLAALPALGCAFVDREVRLSPVDVEAAGSPPLGGTKVAVDAFRDDRRAAPNVVGKVRNGFGIHTAKVTTTDDVGKWIRDSLRNSLRKAGCAEDSPADVSIGGRIVEVDCDLWMVYWSRITLEVTVSAGARRLFQATLTETHRPAAWLGSSEEYQATLHANLADWLRLHGPRIAEAVARAAKETPPAGSDPAP